MFSLFGALFSGGYLCGKISNDNRKIHEFQSKYDTEMRLADSFYNKYSVSDETTNDVRSMILNVDRRMEEFKNELREIVGIEPTHPMLIWGFIAKNRGRIPNRLWASHYDGDNPLSYEHDKIWSNVTIWKMMSIQGMRNARLKFLIWYDKELRSQGMEHQLMFIPAHYERIGSGNAQYQKPYYNISDAKPISECQNLCSMYPANFPATVLWRPTSICVKDILGIV